jgi:hypothetical protein
MHIAVRGYLCLAELFYDSVFSVIRWSREKIKLIFYKTELVSSFFCGSMHNEEFIICAVHQILLGRSNWRGII